MLYMINLTTRGPLYTCLVTFVFDNAYTYDIAGHSISLCTKFHKLLNIYNHCQMSYKK